jgi:DNA-binding transcriptional MocR family regulator
MPAFRWAKTEIMRRSTDDVDPLSSSEAFVLLMLADHYSEAWSRAWPSQSLLAKETASSVKTIVRAVDALRRKGLISTETWVSENGITRIPYRYLLPAYRPAVLPWAYGPVIAYSSWDDAAANSSYESLIKVPGSSLLVDAALLDTSA